MNQIDPKKYEDFFSDGLQVLGIAKQAQAKLDRTAATGFSVFDYFNERENDLSRVFAGLLDPTGAHGQGAAFLKSFLDETGLAGAYPSENEDWRVHLEYVTDTNRRIDIVLNVSDRWLGIENKPWAMEQENQVGHYLEFLRKKDEDAWICYFSGYGADPTSIQETDKDKCLTVPYRKNGQGPSIEGWIERSLRDCEAEPVRWFLKDLLKYIRWRFASEGVPRVDYKGDVMNKALVSFILERARVNPANLEMAFSIEKAMPDVRENLIVEFIGKIKKHLDAWTEDKASVGWDVKADVHMNRYATILLYKNEWTLRESKAKGDQWPAAGVVLHTETARWEDVRLYVAMPDKYDEGFKERLCKKLNKESDGQLKFSINAHSPSPVVARLSEGKRNWNDNKLLKKVIEKQADPIAEEIANQMCEAVTAVKGILDELMKPRKPS